MPDAGHRDVVVQLRQDLVQQRRFSGADFAGDDDEVVIEDDSDEEVEFSD